MEILLPGEVIDNGPKEAGMRFMLLVLLVWRGYAIDRRIWPSTAELADACCCSRNTAAERLTRLEREGWISTLMTSPNGTRLRREIRINTTRLQYPMKEAKQA